jgi:transposase
MKFKVGLHQNQEFLFPKKPSEYLPNGHLAHTIYEICSTLNLNSLENKYSNIGQNAYNPRMMLSLLFYGYSIGIRSSRKISNSCEERFDFNFLSNGHKPSHDRISDFRKENLEEIKELFQEIVLIGYSLGLIKIGNLNISIDGSKIKANASSKLSKDEIGLNKLLNKVEEEISKMLDEAESIDSEEDKKYGKDKRGDELPKILQNKKTRKEAIEKAIAKLKKQKEDAIKKINETKAREPTKTEFKKIENMKINITDNDAKFMKQRNGVIKPNYNCQLSVDEENQFIIANDVTLDCNDTHQFINMFKKTIENSNEIPKSAKADNGYFPELNTAYNLFNSTNILIDDRNRRKEYINFVELKKKYTKNEYINLIKLVSPNGEKEYKKRMHTVEPVFGNIKFNLGFDYMSLREIKKVKGEFNIMCIAHNIKKINSVLKRKKVKIAIAINDFKKSMLKTIKCEKLNVNYA